MSVFERGFFLRVLDTVRRMPVRPGLSVESDAEALVDRVRFWAGHYLATRCDTRLIAASVSGRLAATGDYSSWPSKIPVGR